MGTQFANGQTQATDQEWIEPDSAEDAAAKAEALLVEIQRIEVQLSDKNRQSFDGERINGWAYHEWRAKAVAARAFKLATYRRYKTWLKAANRQGASTERLAKPNIVRRLVELVERLADEDGATLTPSDEDTLDHAWQYLDEQDARISRG